MTGEFCVVCGRTDVAVEDGVCADCFAKRHPLVTVPEHAIGRPLPDVRGAQARPATGRAGDAPRPSSAPEDLYPFLEPHPEVAIRRVEWTDESGHPLPPGRSRGLSRCGSGGPSGPELVRFTVKVEHRTCTECSRRTGHFYTALIQLRAGGRPRGKVPRVTGPPPARVGVRLPEARSEWQRALSSVRGAARGRGTSISPTRSPRARSRG